MQQIMIASLILSILSNIALGIFAYLQREKLKTPPPKPTLSKDARMLLHEITSGEAIVRITPINTDNLLMWRD